MSGPRILKPNGVVLTQDQIEIVDILKETLAQALEGNFKSIGIVVCMADGFASVMCGRQAADLNLACDDLKRKILIAVTEGTAERQSRQSSILRN